MKNNGVVSYLYGDQLGSTSAIADVNGNLVSRTLYHPWGTTRYSQGTNPTDYAYTGQMQEDDIYYYGARWYDPLLGRFMQADTIIPHTQGTQGFDRYAYVNNNPLRYSDPSGRTIYNTLLTDSGGGGMLETMHYFFGWSLNDVGWDYDNTYTVYSTGMHIAFTLGDFSSIHSLLGPVVFYLRDMKPKGLTYFEQVTLKTNDFDKWTVAHELGQVLDFKHNMKLSEELEQYTGGRTDSNQGVAFRSGLTNCSESISPGCNNAGYYYGGIPPKGSNYNFNRREDFAESFAAVFYANEAEEIVSQFRRTNYSTLFYSSYSETVRGEWMHILIDTLLQDSN